MVGELLHTHNQHYILLQLACILTTSSFFRLSKVHPQSQNSGSVCCKPFEQSKSLV